MFALAPKYDKQNDKTKEAKYTHIRAFRKYAELAQASYCLQLQVGMGKIPNDTKFINALIDTNYDQHFTRDRAIQFVSIYEVIAHYTPKQTEGFFGFAPVESKSNHWGKVFENNQHTTITL